MLCKVSKATKILSEIKWSLVNVDWCSVIIEGSRVFSLFACTSEKICITHYKGELDEIGAHA